MSVPERRPYLRAADRRDHILDCALEVFAKKGFHDASVADICAVAHIGRGTLYEYFEDKRAVLIALLDRIGSRVIDAVRQWPPLEIPDDLRSTPERVAAFIEARCAMVMEVVFADTDTAGLLLRMARGSGSINATVARIDEVVVGAVAADLRTGITRGLLRELDPDIAAQFIVGGIEKLVFAAFETGRPVDVARAARDIAVLLSPGLLPADPAADGPPPEGGTDPPT